jgi:hypothetical protein
MCSSRHARCGKIAGLDDLGMAFHTNHCLAQRIPEKRVVVGNDDCLFLHR